MADVFAKAKRSEAGPSVERGTVSAEFMGFARCLKPSEVELVACDAEVFDDVCDDAAWYIARMPCEGNQTIGTKRVGVMSVAAGSAKELTTDFTEAALQLTAIPRGVFSHASGGQNEFVAKGGGDGAARFEQCFQMGLGGLLKAERGFTPVASVGVTTRQEWRLGNPHAVFILADLHFREWNDHGAVTIARGAFGVKRRFDA